MTNINDYEGLGPLPDNWESVALKEVVSKLVDGSHNPPSKQDSGFPMLSARNIEDNQILFDNFRFISEADFEKEHGRTRIESGDVLLTIVGTIGRSAVVPAGLNEFALQRSVAVLTPNGVLSKYLMYQLQAPFVQRHFIDNARGTAQKGVYLKTLGQTPIRVAPLEQQKRIVAEIEKQFSRLDEAVANLKRVRANLKRYKAAVLKAAVEGKLTEEWRKQHPDVEPASKLLERILTERRQKWEEAELVKMKVKGKDPKDDKWKKKYKEPIKPGLESYPTLPNGWAWATIEQLASDEPRSIQSGPFGSNLKHTEFQDSGKLIVGIDNVQDGYFSIGAEHRISETKFHELEKYTARPGDVLITVMATIGRTCVIPDDLEPSIITKHVYRITPNRQLILPDYLHLALWGGAFVREQMFGQVIGQTRPGLNGSIIRRLVIPVPNLKEQALILDAISEKISIIESIHPETEKLGKRSERLRQSILQKAFSGQLVAADPSDEPALILLERIKQDQQVKTQRRKSTKTTKRRKMVTITTESIREVVKQFPSDIFTFEQLREKVSTDYDSLKEMVFTLLGSDNPPFTQTFDKASKQVQFVRVKL